MHPRQKLGTQRGNLNLIDLNCKMLNFENNHITMFQTTAIRYDAM